MKQHWNRIIGTMLLAAATFGAQARQGEVTAIERNEKDNTITSITFAADAQVKATDAKAIFIQYLGLNTATGSMQLKYSITTPEGVTTERYNQFFKGIRIEYASFTLVSRNNNVQYMAGNFYNPALATSTTPAISEAVALNKALATVGATKYMWQDAGADDYLKRITGNPDTSYFPKAELVWIEDFNGQAGDRKLHLAYSFDVYAVKPLARRQIFVDAQTGNILYSNSTIKHTAASGRSLYSGTVSFVTSRVSSTYRLHDSTRGGGVHTMNMRRGTSYTSATEFTSTTNSWPNSTADTAALDAHWGAEKVYDYWYSQQGRNSWNGTGGILLQYVHYDNAYDNAFWDGTEMNYGDGSGLSAGGFTPLTSLDVTAHEIGHGVCEATANLVYSSESGALNEGFSDCWGAVIENWANPGESDLVSKKPWYMGEEIGGGVPLRRLDSPKLYGLPDTYRGTYWYSVTSCTPTSSNDECGVHTNMGVLSKWFYLVTIGASGRNDNGNTYSVTGVGWTKAAKILYQTELALSSTANHTAARTASINATATLYGTCSAEVQAVTNAWYAVGVGAAYSGGSAYVAAIAGPATVAVGSTITLTDSTTGGTWTSVTPSRATISTTGVVTGLATGTDTIKYAVTGTCGTTTVYKVITVTAACSVPVIGAISGATTVCPGASTTFTDTTVGGTWSTAAATIASVSSTGVVYGVAAGSTTITYSKSNACGTGTATKAITVNAATSAGTLSGSTTICLAGTTTLTSTVTGGTWSSSNNAIASVTTAGVVRGNATGTATISYSVTGTCGTAVSTAAVSVISTPTAGTISGTASVCAGATTALTSTVTGGTWSSSNNT
ncbi:MAG: hypothetical protein EBZ77_09890, partial [Chitinophagia bacterium]|nr:hypothetical protein [Chitinophagia bacterium]